MKAVTSLWDYFTMFWFLWLVNYVQNSLADETPRFIREPESVVAKLHAPVRFHCDIAPPTAHIKWLYNGALLQMNPDQGVVLENGSKTLHILSFKHTRKHQPHAGSYQCMVTNNIGTIVSRVATLRRAQLSSFRRPRNGSLVTVDVLVGNTAHLPCDVPKAVPSAFTVFEKNGSSIYRGMDSERHKLSDDGSLQIGNVTKMDEGEYKCIAINSVSHHKRSSKTRIRLRVHAPSGDVALRAVVKPRQRIVVPLGHNVTLPCVYRGHPTPRITWSKYGGKLPSNARLELDNLVIINVTRANNGHYLCHAEGVTGVVETEVAKLEVLVPPRVVDPLSQKMVLVGGKAKFMCTSSGSGPISQVWLHNGQPVTADGHLEITNTSLTINNAQSVHEGMYQCMATSPYGQAHSEGRLTVRKASSMGDNDTVPEELLTPSVVRLDQITRTSVRVRWTLHLGPPVKVFVVQYRLPTRRWQSAGEVTAPRKELVVERLKPKSKYAFRVIVKYEDGASRTSKKASLRLLKNPSRLTREQQDGTSGTALLPPSIERRPVDTRAQVHGTAHLHCVAEHSRGLTWLKDGRWINVSANPRLSVFANGTLEIRRLRRRDAGRYTCAVSNNFKLFANASAFLIVQAADHPTPADGSVVIHGPTSSAEQGGLPTTTNTKKKDPQGMLPPGKPTVRRTSDSSVLLSWVMPANTLPVDFFKVQYKEQMRGVKEEWRTINEELPQKTDKYEVTGLNPGGVYKFRIAVVFVNSNFEMSPPKKFKLLSKIKQTAPKAAPLITHFTSVSDRAIKIYWRFNDEVTFRVDGFFISYRKFTAGGKTEWQVAPLKSSIENSFIISGLEPLTSYEVRVRCFNNKGRGPFSNIVVPKTLEPGATAPPDTRLPPVDQPPESGAGDVKSTPAGATQGTNQSKSHGNSTSRSNDMLYILLGVALGLMLLFLVIFMVLCWRKQRQQNKMMADMDAKYRNKFQDPAQQIYNSQMVPKKHGNGFLLNGINGHATQNGRVPSPYVHSKMNINVNPLTQAETGDPLESDINNVTESSREVSNNSQQRASPSTETLERQRNLQNLQNILDTDDIAPIDYSNFMGTSGSQHSSSGDSRPQFTTFHGSQGHPNRQDDLYNGGSANGSLRHQNRLNDREQSQGAPAKHKRRKKRPVAESSDRTRDQATNTDISSNDGTLENDTSPRIAYPPPPLYQNSLYTNSYDCDD